MRILGTGQTDLSPLPTHQQKILTKYKCDFRGRQGGMIWFDEPLEKSTAAIIIEEFTEAKVRKFVEDYAAKAM